MARTVPVSVPPTTNAWPPRWVEVINRPRPTGGDVVSTNAPAVRSWSEECVNLEIEDDAGYSYSPASPTESYSAQFKISVNSIQYDLFKLYSTDITIEDYVNMLYT